MPRISRGRRHPFKEEGGEGGGRVVESSSKRFNTGVVITGALHNVSLTTPAGLLTALPRVTLDHNRAFGVCALCRPVGDPEPGCVGQSSATTARGRATHLVAASRLQAERLFGEQWRAGRIPRARLTFMLSQKATGIWRSPSKRGDRSLGVELRTLVARMRSLADASAECGA